MLKSLRRASAGNLAPPVAFDDPAALVPAPDLAALEAKADAVAEKLPPKKLLPRLPGGGPPEAVKAVGKKVLAVNSRVDIHPRRASRGTDVLCRVLGSVVDVRSTLVEESTPN